MKLKDEIIRLGVSIEVLADYMGMSYIELAKILQGELICPKEKRKMIEFFLINNYTKCIESAVI